MGYKRFSDAFISEAMIKLALNKYDYAKTAKDLGGEVTVRTLRNWEKKFPKNGVPELLERTISRLLMNIPWQIPSKDYGVILGILLDKWLILSGHPTARSENMLGRLGEMTPDELARIVDEAEAVIAHAFERGDDEDSG